MSDTGTNDADVDDPETTTINVRVTERLRRARPVPTVVPGDGPATSR
ncbi:hypothetical protein [Halorubrum halophilum]|nr:hypothetical protein [Halorubrum halophilum]